MTAHPGGPEGKVLLPPEILERIEEFESAARHDCDHENCPVLPNARLALETAITDWNHRPSPASGAEPLTAEDVRNTFHEWMNECPTWQRLADALNARLSRSPAPAGPTAEEPGDFEARIYEAWWALKAKFGIETDPGVTMLNDQEVIRFLVERLGPYARVRALVDEVNGWREDYQKRTGGAALLPPSPGGEG